LDISPIWIPLINEEVNKPKWKSLWTLVAPTSFAPGFSLIPGSCSGDPFLYLHRLARHLLGSFLTEFLETNPYFRFLHFLTCACLAQKIFIMSFIVILVLSPTDGTCCRLFISCFLRTRVCPVIETSSF
jgi:hypothetical protein